MSAGSDRRSREFLEISDQFKLGALVTESSHPVTARLSEVAKQDIPRALDLLFQVDGDVVAAYRAFVESGRAAGMKDTLLRSLRRGGRIFFTGCGATGRLSIQLVSIWRDFWQRQRARGLSCSPSPDHWEHCAFSVMAGGDYALIKSVEGFEDFAAFGKKQLGDLGVSERDIVFAITEGGETSFVIGTAWKGLEAGAKVCFVYNNPDDVLCEHIQRSREVIRDPRMEKLNLTTGPMAISGSTRMQATTIQLCVLVTVLEMTLRDLMGELEPGGPCALPSSDVPARFQTGLAALQATLRSSAVRLPLAELAALEESVYRSGHKNNYYADALAMDVLTDTTERSPTYCTPPFRKFDDLDAAESWAFLFLPCARTEQAWEHLLKRPPACLAWSPDEVRELAGDEKAVTVYEVVRKIGRPELMRFKIGRDGASHRRLNAGDCAVAILREGEEQSVTAPDGFCGAQFTTARRAGARTGLIHFGRAQQAGAAPAESMRRALSNDSILVSVPVPESDFVLDGVTRVGAKMLLNALSTCTMVRLGRVMGNTMIWVVASNLKLIDRATRYIRELTGLAYPDANRLLFEVIEYIEPRRQADQAHPPVVGLAVLRARHGLTNEQAEQMFLEE